MISSVTARIMNLGDRVTLAAGQREDLMIINEATRLIEGTMSGGRWTHLCGDVAARVSGLPAAMPVAAE